MTANSGALGVTSMRTHLCGRVAISDVGTAVRVCGWVAKRREHGEHLAFIDLRDHTGIVQCVVPGTVDVRSEYVLAIEGVVRPRPEGTVNPDLPTGMVELGECSVTVLASADPPPFVVEDRVEVDEGIPASILSLYYTERHALLGALIIAFSISSWYGTSGGLIIGFIVGVIGGFMTLTWHPLNKKGQSKPDHGTKDATTVQR